MGLRQKRPLTPAQQQAAQTKKDLLDTQDLLANQFEENQKINTSLLDTQDLLANIIEKGGVL